MNRSLLILFSLLLILSCENKKRYDKSFTPFQKEMNEFFKDASISPLKEKDLKIFKGLDFFAFDSSYVVPHVSEIRSCCNPQARRKAYCLVSGIDSFNNARLYYYPTNNAGISRRRNNSDLCNYVCWLDRRYPEFCSCKGSTFSQ